MLSTGYLTVTVENTIGIVVTLLPKALISIDASGTWSQSWTWTPTAPGNYTAKAVYEEN